LEKAVSVPLNIAEGAAISSKKQLQIQFFLISYCLLLITISKEGG
jgi:hypothetical protein